ncbi:MAG: triose-phosphate isomerase [Planctomycetes bacterium]|nr:triose-phosphate isomerase [Planctomycetota bacterium]
MRRPLVAGNWKMNLNLAQANELVAGIRAAYDPSPTVEVAVCPPAVYLIPVVKAVGDSGIAVGAQDLYFEPSGAYTGEISAAMIADTGAKCVIIGHSERRHTISHHEDDWMMNRKVAAALATNLTPILCVGETVEQRKAGQTLAVLTFQLIAGLADIPLADPEQVVIAYEPVWAIGTGQVATPEQAQEAHAHLRDKLGQIAGQQIAAGVRILYGGSMKPDNAAEIMSKPDVDGGLIGGASLKPDSFVGIIRAAAAAAV